MLEGLSHVFKESKRMSTILTTVLITAPLAFLVGWLLSKLGESLGVSQKLIV